MRMVILMMMVMVMMMTSSTARMYVTEESCSTQPCKNTSLSVTSITVLQERTWVRWNDSYCFDCNKWQCKALRNLQYPPCRKMMQRNISKHGSGLSVYHHGP